MPYLNLGIVAHVDAGKTSLTERLLYEAGVLDAPGSVDRGTTRTDSMDLERRRGITIRAAVTSFAIDDLQVTVVDTPGHPDFVAEVERSLTVLDAAVLVVSAVEGVQPQTVVIWRALRRIGVPTVLMVNKVDRAGSDVARALDQVARRLTPRLVTLAAVEGEGRPDARVHGVPLTDPSVVQSVADVDDLVLARWVDGEPARGRDVAGAVRRGVRDGALTPVVVGSAVTGVGMTQLRQVLSGVLPRADEAGVPAAATVFAVDRDGGGRRAWVRLWSGEIAARELLVLAGRRPARVTEVAVSAAGGSQARTSVRGGQIAVLRGLADVRVGDVIGRPPARRQHRFAPPTMQALVEPVDPNQRTALFAALTELADEDPLIDLRLDPADGEAAVSLHGEVQKEVIAALLDERFGVRARFSPTSVVCLERVVGTGSSVERLGQDDNPYLATVGLRVQAAPVGHGVEFSPGVERGNLPPAFIAATEEGVRSALRHGLRGWPVTDCLVTMTASAYFPRQSRPHQKFDKSMSSVGADFRNLTPVVVLAALRQARTVVCQPVERIDLEVPDASLTAVIALLGRLRGAVVGSTWHADRTRLTATLLSARVPDLARALPDLTGGEAVLVTEPHHHAPVPGDQDPPSRRRRGVDPGDRATWFRHVPR